MFGSFKTFFTASASQIDPAIAEAYAAAVLEDIPLAYWRLGETSGTTAVDEVGSYDGTYQGSPALGPAGIHPGTTAMTADIGDYCAAPSVGGLATFTVEMWVKRHGTQYVDRAYIADKYPADVNFAIFPAGSTTVRAGIFKGAWYRTPSIELADETWTHLVMTYDGATIKLYVDGVLGPTFAVVTTPTSSGGEIRIGARWDNTVLNPNADICEVAIYAGVLSEARITLHHTLGTGGPLDPLALDPYYYFSGPDGSMLATGGSPAGDGVAIATMDNLATGGNAEGDATQTTGSLQAIFRTANDAADFDGADDRYDITPSSPITGTMVCATNIGTLIANVSIPASLQRFSGKGLATFHGSRGDELIVFGVFPVLSASQRTEVLDYVVGLGAAEDFGAQTSLNNYFNSMPLLTEFPVIDTSAVTDFFGAWSSCSSLTSFPSINIALGYRFGFTWNGCTSLVDFPAGFFDSWNPASVFSGAFNAAWQNCSSLSATSVENILNSLDTSGVWATNDGTSGGTPIADDTIDINYDAGSGTPSITTAVTNLKARSWQINLNGVLQ